jgi:E3 ubiquitin-protein ligase UBR4
VEEFIRGHMTKNPYSSAEIDCATVRDVKNFICAALDMHGLCDDDYGMELLVAGRIVALDLPIGAVYEHVWRKALTAGDAAARDDDAQNGGRGGLRHHLDDDDEDGDDYDEDIRGGGRGLHSSTFRLNVSHFGHTSPCPPI